jgi:hypothetical protein
MNEISTKLPQVSTFLWIIFVGTLFITEEIETIHYIEMIVSFAILVLVPMIIRDYNRKDVFYRLATMLHVPFGLIAVSSFYFTQGFLSSVLTIPWIFITALLGLSGLVDIIKNKSYHLPFPLLINVSHMMIVIGSGWLFLHRTGLEILHFSDQIILLTAIHFHYAAFITPYIIAKTGKVVLDKRTNHSLLYQLLAVGTIIGIPIIAIGITFNQIIEFFGMLILATTLIVFASFQFFVGNKFMDSAKVKTYLSIACICVLSAMIFSFVYGFGHLTPDNHEYIISVEQMVVTHGILNSIGFGLFGVLGSLMINKASKE